MIGLIPIAIGILALFNYKVLLDYGVRINNKSGKPINRKIMLVRLIVVSAFSILFSRGNYYSFQ